MPGTGRRRFLVAGGTAAGALMVGGGAWIAVTPRIELPATSFPGVKGMDGRVLIAYASKAGSTAEVAAFVGRRLSGLGPAVDVRRAADVGELEGYDAVIVGSAIRAGQWLPEARAFVEKHKGALAHRRTAFFTLCMTLSHDTPGNREKVAAYLKPVRAILEPQQAAFFAGRMEYRKLALGPRWIVKAMKVPEGDFRDWNAIGAWADQLSTETRARA